MNMFFHNLKVALRNLLKYKVQTMGSILSLAIGMVTLAMMHSLLLNARARAISDEAYYDRVYTIRFDSIQKRQTNDAINANGDIIRAIKANGGLRSIEQGPYAPNGLMSGGIAEFLLTDKTKRKMALSPIPIERHYPNFAGFRSAITGEKIKVLDPHDAIISKKLSQQIFGDRNPVGTSVNLMSDDENYQLKIVDVYQDLSLNEVIASSTALYFSVCEFEEMDFNQYYAPQLYVTLKDGSTPQQLEAEVNGSVKPLGLKAEIQSLKEQLDEEDAPVATGRFITYLISSLILLAAIIGFMRMHTQLFWMRRREISLRITNGATRLQLFSMFATEVVTIVLLAYTLAVMMGAWICDYLAKPQFAYITSELATFSHLYLYSLVISLLVIVLCLTVIWIVLTRICRRVQALESGMR